MTIVKKSLLVFLVFVLIVLGLELAVKYFSDFGVFRELIVTELSERLEADVEIQRVGLDVLPLPQLELHDLRMVFADGTVLRVPLVRLSLTLKGLFSGRPEIMHISLESPEAQIDTSRRPEPDPEPDNQTVEAQQKELILLINSALQSLPPCRVTTTDGTVYITASGGSLLDVEKVAVQLVITSQGLNFSASCASALWEKLTVNIHWQDPWPALKVSARGIDPGKSADLLIYFAGDIPPLTDIKRDIQGVVSSVSFEVSLPSLSAPLERAVVSGRGSFEDMSVAVPETSLELHELSGGFTLDNDVLAVTGISALLGKSRIREAVIQLDSVSEFKLSLITAEYDLDFSDAPGLLHLIPDADVRSEIALIKNPRGTASGTFELRAEGDSYSTEIAVRELELQSSYRAFPPKLTLQAGRCTYRDDLLSFENFSANLGSSSLPDFSLSFSFRDDDHFTAAAKGATIEFGDLRMVLDSFDGSQKLINTIATSPDGRLTIQSLELEGPLAKPESWTIAVEALLEDVSISAAGLDGPVEVHRGALKANKNSCTLSGVRLTYLDARLSGSLTLDGYFDGIRTATADVRGMLGAKALADIQSAIDMPPVLALQAPVKIEKSRLAWSREGATTVAGDFVLGGKSKVGLNLIADNNILEIKELKIRDAASQCRFGMKIEEDVFSITYAGMLKKDTFDRVLLNNRLLQGWVKGDISVLFNQKNPRGSSATGTLAWEKAGSSAFDTLPVILTSAEIKAQGKLLTIGSAGLAAGQDSAGLQGSIDFSEDVFALDLILDADTIDVDAITDRLSSDNASSDDSSFEEFWETPLRGTVRFKALELKKDAFTCTPFEALISFDDRAITVNTEGTKLCSVALPATVRITPDDITLDAQLKAEKSPMKKVVLCLSGERSLITGTVDIDGAVRAQSKPDMLLDSLSGEVSMRARDGRIYQSGVIAKIVSFLSIQNLLTLNLSDMVTSGYAYQSLDIDGEIKGQILELTRVVLISNSFTLVLKGTIDLESEKIDFDALVTPFQMFNLVLSKVPLIGGWLGKPIVGVPLKIDGFLENPQVRSRATSSVYTGLMDITIGIMKLPVRIISPVLPKKSSDEE